MADFNDPNDPILRQNLLTDADMQLLTQMQILENQRQQMNPYPSEMSSPKKMSFLKGILLVIFFALLTLAVCYGCDHI